jgi:hypothetical protein
MRNLTLLCAAACLGVAAIGLMGDDKVKDPEAEKIAELVKLLGDDSFAAREKATRELEKLGEKAVPAVAEAAAETDDLEVRRRALRIILAVMPQAHKSKSAGLAMVRILPGTFTMGSPAAELGRQADEPEHRVRITRPIYVGAYEVSQEEYEKVMKVNPSYFSDKGDGSGKVAGIKTGRFPVENVTWFDALEFCNRLSKLDADAVPLRGGTPDAGVELQARADPQRVRHGAGVARPGPDDGGRVVQAEQLGAVRHARQRRRVDRRLVRQGLLHRLAGQEPAGAGEGRAPLGARRLVAGDGRQLPLGDAADAGARREDVHDRVPHRAQPLTHQPRRGLGCGWPGSSLRDPGELPQAWRCPGSVKAPTHSHLV